MRKAVGEGNCNANARAMHVGVIHELPLQKTLPDGWRWTSIDDIAEVNPRIDKSQIPDDLLVSFVPMPAVGAGNGYINVSDKKPFASVKKGFTPFKEGDVLFAKITPCMENGKMAVVPSVSNGYGFGSTEFHVLRPKEGIDAHYIYYYMSSKTVRGEAERYMTGAVGQKRVSTQYLRESKIPIAPLTEQTLIVAEIEKQFSRLDEAVAALKRIKANLKRYKASVLKAAVEGKLTEEWRRGSSRTTPIESGKDLLKRILAERRKKWEKEHPGKKYKEPSAVGAIHELPLQNELPEGWVWATIEQVSNNVQYGSSSKTSDRQEGIPVLRMGNIVEGKLSFNNLKYLPKSHAEFPGLLLISGDILFNRTNSPELVGKTAVYQGHPKPCSFASYLIRVQVVPLLMPEIISYYINSSYGRNWIKSVVSQQVGQANVNGTKLQALAIPIPSLEEQSKIIDEVDRRLSVAEEIELEIETNLKRAERLRQSILKKAFSGRLVQQTALKRKGNS